MRIFKTASAIWHFSVPSDFLVGEADGEGLVAGVGLEVAQRADPLFAEVAGDAAVCTVCTAERCSAM